MKISIGIIGITGKMGQALCEKIKNDGDLNLVGGISSKEISSTFFLDLAKKADVIIDFSVPSSLKNLLFAAEKYNTPLIIGTTGYGEKELEEIEKSSKKIPIILSYNFSLGIAICSYISKIAAKLQGDNFKIHIEETHHVNKKDKPSGTALMLKDKMEKEVPITSYREGSVIGIHRVIFSSENEEFEISHRAISRDVFADGALASAKFIIGKPPKLYSIEEMLLK